jgi:hypothetical protein
MRAALIIAGILIVGLAWAQEARVLTDAQVTELIMQESQRAYSGNCPCPYNVDQAGRRCSGRSEWSRPGGAQPICYASEISDEQVRRYRERHGIESP